MLIRHLARPLVVLCAAGAARPGGALAQTSISLTGTYAKPGVYRRDGDRFCP